MLNCKFSLATILLASLTLAAQSIDVEDGFLPLTEDLDHLSVDFPSYLPSSWDGYTHESAEDLIEKAEQRWLHREHIIDLYHDYLSRSELDNEKYDDSSQQILAPRNGKKTKPAPANEPKNDKKAQENAAKAAKTAQENTAKADKKAKDNAAKAAKTTQENTAKANKKAQDQEKKTKDNAAKADKKAKNDEAKAEKQKQKDQKLVKDNLALEKKAQNKAGAAAQKKLDNTQKKNQKDNANENKNFQNQQKKLQQTLAKSEGDFNKQKGKKGEQKAAQNLAKAKAAVANLPDQHKARIDKLYNQALATMAKDRAGLDKGLTKAHTDQFDASGKAKVHQSVWSKIGTIMSYLGPAMLSFVPGVGAAVMGAMTAGRVASAAVQAGVKEGVKSGVKAGVKQGTKQGTKQATKQGEKAIDWKKEQDDQIKVSQQNKDSNINAYEQKRLQIAQAMKPQKRDVEEDLVVDRDRLTPRRIYNSARSVLLEDMIWDDLIYEDI